MQATFLIFLRSWRLFKRHRFSVEVCILQFQLLACPMYNQIYFSFNWGRFMRTNLGKVIPYDTGKQKKLQVLEYHLGLNVFYSLKVKRSVLLYNIWWSRALFLMFTHINITCSFLLNIYEDKVKLWVLQKHISKVSDDFHQFFQQFQSISLKYSSHHIM